MIPLLAADLAIAFMAGVAFSVGAMTPIGAVALVGLALVRPRNRKL